MAAITSNLTTSLELGFAGEDQNSRHSQGNDEIVRLAGMLSCRSTRLQESIARFLGQDRSAVSRDIHWLNCISRTSNERASGFSEPVETKIADTLVGLSRRIQSQGLDLDRNFYPRMKTLVNSLFKKCEGALANRTASQISGDGGDAYLIESLPEEARAIGLERFASRIEQYPGDVTSTQIQVLASHPSSKHVKLIRKFGSRPELRDAVSKSLSKYASPEDRDLFVQGLRSSDLETLKQSAKALQQLPEDSKPIALIYSLLASRKLGWDRASVRVRDELVLLLQKWTDQNFGYQPKEDELNQNDVLQEWSHWIRETYPEEFEAAFQNPKFPAFAERIESVDWNSGDADRGRHLYKKLQCAQCHDGGTRLGPRLGGITKRLGHEDLFRSIVLPNEQVPERYRMLVVETVDGKLFRGSVVYESVDGITLQESGGQTVRINRKDIEARVLSEKSLMPEGLLRETADQDWSDLYAYLKSQ